MINYQCGSDGEVTEKLWHCTKIANLLSKNSISVISGFGSFRCNAVCNVFCETLGSGCQGLSSSPGVRHTIVGRSWLAGHEQVEAACDACFRAVSVCSVQVRLRASQQPARAVGWTSAHKARAGSADFGAACRRSVYKSLRVSVVSRSTSYSKLAALPSQSCG